MNPKTLRLLIALLVVLGAWVLLVEKPFTDDLRGPSTRNGRVFPDFEPVELPQAGHAWASGQKQFPRHRARPGGSTAFALHDVLKNASSAKAVEPPR